MHSDELPVDILTNDFNARTFLMALRRENERLREISILERDRYHSKSRGFSRMKNPSYSSEMVSEKGMDITDQLSKQLLDENLSLVHRHWKRSEMKFSNEIAKTHSDLTSKTNISLKKSMCRCQAALFKWIARKRLRSTSYSNPSD